MSKRATRHEVLNAFILIWWGAVHFLDQGSFRPVFRCRYALGTEKRMCPNSLFLFFLHFRPMSCSISHDVSKCFILSRWISSFLVSLNSHQLQHLLRICYYSTCAFNFVVRKFPGVSLLCTHLNGLLESIHDWSILQRLVSNWAAENDQIHFHLQFHLLQ